jgi:tRNA-binding EMAP/Myf-like protein
MQHIEWADFQQVQLRVGTVLSAEPNDHACKPAYGLRVELGAHAEVRVAGLYDAHNTRFDKPLPNGACLV